MSYKSICSNCGGNDYYITPHNNLGYCFHCGYYENDSKEPIIVKPSKNIELIRARYTQAAEYYHSCLSDEHYRYLISRGYKDSTIKERKIGFCPEGTHPMYKDAIAKESGLATYDNKATLANRITFPYYVYGDNSYSSHIVVDIRGRVIDDSEIRYRSPNGTCIFRGAIYPYNAKYAKCDELVLTEGEIGADISSQELELPTMGLPGITAWRKGFKPKETQKVTLVFDSQQKRPDIIRRAIKQVALYIDNLWIATLPLLGKVKQDLDSCILEHGVKFTKMVIDGAMPFPKWLELQR